MRAVVTGGASSGKSACAERLALALPGPHLYLATMRHGDAETEQRIDRHRRMREGKGFETVELVESPASDNQETALPDMGALSVDLRMFEGTALLEDLGNLVLNGLQGMLPEILSFSNVVVVANEIGCDGADYDGYTRKFIGELGSLACAIAHESDLVVEVVCGIPVAVKGELPWAC